MPTTAAKQGTGEIRHDLEPLTTRFAALGSPVRATWLSGVMGGEAPGPSTYWIDAVVELQPATAAALRAKAAGPSPEQPAVVEPLRELVPKGLLVGPELDAAFAQGSFRASAYIAKDADVLVLVALGE